MILPALFFMLGVIYGFIHPGRENRIRMIKRTILLGIVVGLVVGFFISTFLFGIFALFAIGPTIIAFVLLFLSIAIPFILGTLVGDILERLL